MTLRLKNLSSEQQRYLTSERFIHDDLVKMCESLVHTACAVWDNKQNPDRVFLWPSETLTTDDGVAIEGVVLAPIPSGDRKAGLRKLVERTKAYGLLLVEKTPHALIATFESPHGACCWTLKVEQHGDIDRLGDPVVTTDKDYLGVLWSPNQGRA